MVRMAAFKSYSKVMAVSFLFLRHCERSEAIHERQARLDCFVASAPRKKVAQKRCHTTNIEPQTFIQGGSVPYPPVPTRNDGFHLTALVSPSACAAPARRRWMFRSGLFDRREKTRRSRCPRLHDGSPPRSRSIPVPAGDAGTR